MSNLMSRVTCVNKCSIKESVFTILLSLINFLAYFFAESRRRILIDEVFVNYCIFFEKPFFWSVMTQSESESELFVQFFFCIV